jgi:hypothetical protein
MSTHPCAMSLSDLPDRLFIIEGLATVCISLVAFFILPGKLAIRTPARTDTHAHPADYPTTTKWLSEREKALAVARLVSNEDNVARLSHRQAFMAAVKDIKTWVSLLGLSVNKYPADNRAFIRSLPLSVRTRRCVMMVDG